MIEFKVDIITILLILQLKTFSSTTHSHTCEGLIFNGDLICYTPPNNNKSFERNNCKENQEIGTVAKYECTPFYEFHDGKPPGKLSTSTPHRIGPNDEKTLTCGPNGTWIGISRFKSYLCREKCGKRLTSPKALIVNGLSTNHTFWPWHAAIYRRDGEIFQYICGGSIIKSSAILTAAHCVTTPHGGNISADSTIVVLGAEATNFTENRNRDDVQIINVSRIFVSESYDVKKEFQADIAILELAQDIEYNDQVSPVCIPLPNEMSADVNAVKLGRLGDVVGFGVDQNGELSGRLKHAKLEIKSHSECFLKLERILSESQFCAGNLRGDKWETVCNGDSGGGLVLPSTVHEKYYVHGIVSTGEPLSHGQAVCQNYAVFTRVYSFIPWIRDVLEEISGDPDRPEGETFPYEQSGTETRRYKFTLIPKEWENAVGSIELSYLDIKPEIFLNSLEYSKTVRSINLTQVKLFPDRFPPKRRVFLPQLKSVYMDVLRDDLVVDENRSFPVQITNEFLSSLVLFFEKDLESEENFDISFITLLKTNFEVIVHVFRLMEINHDTGKITLSQIPFSNSILRNLPLPPDFRLVNLALSKCPLNLTLLTNHVSGFRTLVLDQVEIHGGRFEQFLKRLVRLEELVIVQEENVSPPSSAKSPITIDIIYLPKSIKHLALSGVVLNFTRIMTNSNYELRPYPIFDPSSLVFPDSLSSTKRQVLELQNVETFYCNLCLLETNSSIQELSKIFPNLKQMVLKSSLLPQNQNWSQILQENFQNLEFTFIQFGGRGEISKKFVKVEGLLHEEEEELESKNEFDHLDYSLTRRGRFFSSEAEHVSLTRLYSTERIAFESGHYRFNGQLTPLPDGTNRPVTNLAEDRFSPIPFRIQDRLKSIEIVNAEFIKEDLESSIRNAKLLRYLRFINVSTPESLYDKIAQLPNLEEFSVHTTTSNNVVPLFGFKGLITYFNNIFHLAFPYREEGIDYRTSMLRSKLHRIHIQYGDCKFVSWDSKAGSLTSVSGHTNNWLKNLNVSDNPFGKNHLLQKLAVNFMELDPTVVPTTVTHLNLNFVVLKHVGRVLERLTTLRVLQLVNVRVSDDDEYKDWERSRLNLTELSLYSSKTLEHLALEKSHVWGYSEGIKLDKVELVYFEDCTFESDFIQNFVSVFPNVKTIVILGGYSNSQSQKNTSDFADTLMLQVLKEKSSASIQRIISRQPNSSNLPGRIEVRQEIESILNGDGLPGLNEHDDKKSSKYFSLQRMNGSWVAWNCLEDATIKAELNHMKGLLDFGVAWYCHAYTFVGQSLTGTIPT